MEAFRFPAGTLASPVRPCMLVFLVAPYMVGPGQVDPGLAHRGDGQAGRRVGHGGGLRRRGGQRSEGHEEQPRPRSATVRPTPSAGDRLFCDRSGESASSTSRSYWLAKTEVVHRAGVEARLGRPVLRLYPIYGGCVSECLFRHGWSLRVTYLRREYPHYWFPRTRGDRPCRISPLATSWWGEGSPAHAGIDPEKEGAESRESSGDRPAR